MAPTEGTADRADEYVVIAYNDLGMHCMDADYSVMSILPPFNTFRAQVLKKGGSPDIIHNDVTLEYWIPSNTRSADKTNFWRYAPALFGVNLAPDVGLFGKGLRGTMEVTPAQHYDAVGIPLVPFDDSGIFDPYPLATVRVLNDAGVEVARTQSVMPVSQELNCKLCHEAAGVATEVDILRDHDRLHGTTLEQNQPVLCAACHADVALGAPGVPNVPSLSSAIHAAHATRMGKVDLANVCYACHPGVRTDCQRDVHLANNVVCIDCHGNMGAVGSPTRRPWVDQPRCGTCHSRPGFEFEQANTLFKDSRGHGGVNCFACHGSPHAITPTVTAADNLQATRLQGTPGALSDCLACHTQMPGEAFFHRLDD
ncbi:MAG: cytochrome c3 family protein [Phycisphaerae bacterium]|nr:cytochrome c3 family protein [Phycisphaerae bacterium]